jgi:hypothetical protein
MDPLPRSQRVLTMMLRYWTVSRVRLAEFRLFMGIIVQGSQQTFVYRFRTQAKTHTYDQEIF